MFGFFKKRKENDDYVNRIRLIEQNPQGNEKLLNEEFPNILSYPSISAEDALNELCDFFLGEDWYSEWTAGAKQTNFDIVESIERKFPRRRREMIENHINNVNCGW